MATPRQKPYSTSLTTTNAVAGPSRSLNRQVVLDEDEYTEALSRIIARDFFPSLVQLDATNDYLDAIRTHDPALISASVRRLADLQTPLARGAGPTDTPLHTPRTADGPPSKRARYDDGLSLDEFQARYTSEDNSSFTQILDEENRQRKGKWAWAWEAQRRVEAQRDKMIEGRERLLLEAPGLTGVKEQFVIEPPMVAGMITDGKEDEGEDEAEVENELDPEWHEAKGMEVALSEEATKKEQVAVDVMAPKKDTRSAAVDGWRFKNRNALMFSPDADISPYHNHSVGPIDPKSITHASTRLPEQDDGSGSGRGRGASAPPSPTRSRIDAAIAGTPYRPRSPEGSFSLVPNLPSPTPSELGPAAVKQLMTWGTLNGTPRVLSSTDPAEPTEPTRTPFHIPAPSARESISHKLSARASKSLRAKAGLIGTPLPGTPGIGAKRKAPSAGNMPPPIGTPRRSEAALTPAARRLLDRTTMGTAAARRAEAMGKQAGWGGQGERERDLGRVRWTPTPESMGRKA